MTDVFEYSVCNQADEEIFKKQCAALEQNIQGIEKERFLEDVDGSLIQKYRLGAEKITVFNSNYCNEVYIKSTIDLVQFFNKD